MEKVCEFCRALRPAVYCQADSALLCLSCDSKVHSANALSNRHLRSLLCDSCQACPALVRCDYHGMYMCPSCDRSLHSSSSPSSQRQHQRRAINSYIGCPSAKDFAALWDLDLNELKDSSSSNLIVSSSQDFMDMGDVSSDALRQYYQQQREGSSVGSIMSCTDLIHAGMPNAVTNNQQSNKESRKGQQQQLLQNQSSQFILQQILDLKRLQLNEGNCYSPAMSGEQEHDISSSSGKALRLIDEGPDENSQHSQDLEAQFVKSVTSLEELKLEGFSSPFSSLENWPATTSGASQLGVSFWQWSSPLHTSQLMSQNIQDLGVCKDLICSDDINSIPDIDATFQSFEELFGGDQDPTPGLLTRDNDLSCSLVDRETSLNKSENSHAPVMENASASSSTYLGSVIQVNSDRGPSNQVSHSLRPSYSAVSFSISQETEGASRSLVSGAADFGTKDSTVTRNRDNKKARLDGEKMQHALLRGRTNGWKRVKRRLDKSEGQNPR